MFHACLSSFFAPVRTGLATALPGDAYVAEPGARGRHAQALSYAATRRRAAVQAHGERRGVDRAYWTAGVPAALARAAGIRSEQGFARLP